MENKINLDWLKNEQLNTTDKTFEKLPALKLDEGKVYEIQIDATQPFDEFVDVQGATKKIIPVWHKENGVSTRKIFWLNKRNPLYREIRDLLLSGQNTIKIIRTGQAKGTRYTRVI